MDSVDAKRELFTLWDFGLSEQKFRSSLLDPSNKAEGYEMQANKEHKQTNSPKMMARNKNISTMLDVKHKNVNCFRCEVKGKIFLVPSSFSLEPIFS